jgi:hypothetical protein
MNLEVFYVVVHSQTMTDAPTPFEHPAAHRMFIQPFFLVVFHSDLSLPTRIGALARQRRDPS